MSNLKTFVGTLVFALATSGAWAQGVDNPNVFELDGNTQDGADPGLDWQSTFPPGTPTTALPIQDPAPLTIFTTGGSKDVNDTGQWRWSNGSVPDKDNILQAVAAALNLPNGDTAVYFAASRFANNGDAQIGLWFFQQQVSPQANGTFGPQPGVLAHHVDGDLLVLINFENGGLIPGIAVYKWQGGVNGGPVLDTTLNTGICGTGDKDVCARTNATAQPAPANWNYVPKSGPAGTFPPQSFFEGGVNLSAIFGAGNVPCFSSFLAETRSSSSITAQLKDFAEGTFELCKVGITKTCSFVEVTNGGTALKYSFGGLVTNEGQGTLYNVQVIDTPSVPGVLTPANPVLTLASLSGGQSAPWAAEFVTDALAFNDVATAIAASTPQGAQTVTDTTTAPCQGAVNSSINITKLCSPGTSLVDNGDTVVVQVGVSGQVCNSGDALLNNIVLAHSPITSINLSSNTLAPGACATWDATYLPPSISSGNGAIPGRYFFDDSISVASATPAVGPPLTPPGPGVCPSSGDLACAAASCPLCPPGLCVVDPFAPNLFSPLRTKRKAR
jgi:hypothetical protein